MILSFHRRKFPRVVPRPAALPLPQDVTPTFRATNRRGDPLRRSVLAFLRARGRATLADVGARYGQRQAVMTLLALAQAGLVEVLDGDEFRAIRKER